MAKSVLEEPGDEIETPAEEAPVKETKQDAVLDERPKRGRPKKADAEKEPEKKAEEKKEPEPDWKAKAEEAEKKYENSRAALRETREKSRAEIEEARRQVEELAKIKADLEAHRQSVQKKKQEEEWAKDPANYLRRELEETNQRVGQMTEAQQRQMQESQRMQQLSSVVSSHEAAFVGKNPDYHDAVNHLRESRLAEYEMLGYPPEQRIAIVAQEGINLAISALQNGKDPAEVAYSLAAARGYKRVEPKKEPDKAKAEEAIDRLEKGAKASKTLSGGSEEVETSLLKQVEEMSPSEFDKFWKQFEREQKGARH